MENSRRQNRIRYKLKKVTNRKNMLANARDVTVMQLGNGVIPSILAVSGMASVSPPLSKISMVPEPVKLDRAAPEDFCNITSAAYRN